MVLFLKFESLCSLVPSTKQLTIGSIFSGLPWHYLCRAEIISHMIQIENNRKNYDKVVEQLNKLSTIDYFCPSIRDMMEAPLVCGGGEGQGKFGCWVAWAVEQELLFDDTADLPW